MRSSQSIPCLEVAFLFLSVVCIAAPAGAGEGVFELGQVCATQSGCFPGDAAGFPITIVQPGSYRLTSNLAVPNQNTSAVFVTAHDVSIDLGGFTISGVTTCSESTLTCSPTGSGRGIDIDLGIIPDRLSVRRGTIRGMGNRGILAGSRAIVEDVRAESNGGTGIETGSHSLIKGCVAYLNGVNGLQSSNGSILDGNLASGNASSGIVTSDSSVRHNIASRNGSIGIVATSGASLLANDASNNRGDGILVSLGGATLDGNVTNGNVSLGSPSDEDGVQCGSDCVVRNHTANGNDGFGLNLTAGSTYAGSVATGNSRGGVAAGANLGGNYCAGPGVTSASCP
jgi:hypothetical protein